MSAAGSIRLFLSLSATLISQCESTPLAIVAGNYSLDKITSQFALLKTSQLTLETRLDELLNVTLNIGAALKKLTSIVCLINHSQGCGVLVQQHVAGPGAPFDREWRDFKNGFNDTRGNYWIGNEKLHAITQKGKCTLRIDMQAKFNYQWYFAEYSNINVDDERSDYRLLIGGYKGDAGDSFHSAASYKDEDKSCLNWMPFTTSNIDNDNWDEENCASSLSNGGFWFNSCASAFLNGGVDSVHGFTWSDLPVGSSTADKQLLVSRMTLYDCD